MYLTLVAPRYLLNLIAIVWSESEDIVPISSLCCISSSCSLSEDCWVLLLLGPASSLFRISLIFSITLWNSLFLSISSCASLLLFSIFCKFILFCLCHSSTSILFLSARSVLGGCIHAIVLVRIDSHRVL